MSYILDALRRADAERERGTLPGLHTQAVPAGSPDSDEERPPRPWGWIVAASIAVLGLAAWWFMGRADTPDPAAAVTAAPPPPIPTAVAPGAPEPAAVSTPTVPPTSPPTSTAATGPVATAAAGMAAASVAAAASSAAMPAADSARAGRKPAAAAAPTRKPAASAVAAARPAARLDAKPADGKATDNKASEPEARPPLLSQLPEEVRRGLPSITIGGSIYSKSPANRMLVINGQVFHEGDELMPALVLEQIKQKAAVLNFKGFRYEVGY